MMIQPPAPKQLAAPAAPPAVPRAGVNTRLASTPFGFVISGAPSGGGSFNHPFQVVLVGRDGVRISKGLVESFEPVITSGKSAGVPISGDAANNVPPPTLPLKPDVANARMESWVCVEVTPGATGQLAGEKGQLASGVKIEVVHCSEPTLVGAIGRQPLALIVWSKKAPSRIYPITFFNLRYHRTSPAPGKGPKRHYFF